MPRKLNSRSYEANSITADAIATGAIATVDLADGTITSLKIADGAIGTIDIADAAITSTKLSSALQSSVNSIANKADTTTVNSALALKADTSSLGTLATLNSVGTSTITDAAVTSAKLASGSAVSNIGYTPLNKAGDTLNGALLGANGRNIINSNGTLNILDDNSFDARAEYPSTNGANGQMTYLGDDQGNAASGYARTYHQLCKKAPGGMYSHTYMLFHRGDVNYFYGGIYQLRVNSWYSSDRNNFHESVSIRCLAGRRDGIRVYIFNNGQGIWISANSSWGGISVRKVHWEDQRNIGAAYCACENGGPLNGSYINTTLPSGQLATLEADGGYNIRSQVTFNG